MQFLCRLLVSVLSLMAIHIICVSGDYNLFVRVHSYSNPLDHCSTCRESPGAELGCCDQITNKGQCDANNKCDTYYAVCLRPLAFSADSDDCGSRGPMYSSVNINDGMIDFSQNNFLGFSNPIPLSGLSNVWQGVQLLVRAFDDNPGISDRLIDKFVINIFSHVAQVNVPTQPVVYRGENRIAQIQLSFLVQCSDNFVGTFCDEKLNLCLMDGLMCNGNGVCLDNNSCSCTPGFSGEFCELDINDCSVARCSGNGQCIDGVNNYTCNCNPGFRGINCDTAIDPCSGVQCSGNGHCEESITNRTVCVCDDGFEGDFCEQMPSTLQPGTESYIPIAAGAGGAIVLILCVILLIVIIAVCKRRKPQTTTGAQREEYGTNNIQLQDNPTYSLRRDLDSQPDNVDQNMGNVLVVSPWTNASLSPGNDLGLDDDGYVDCNGKYEEVHVYEIIPGEQV